MTKRRNRKHAHPTPPQAPRSERGWMGAQLSRVLDFATALRSEDEEIRRDIGKMRAHSRDLGRNNPLLARYFNLVPINIVGTGIKLQCDIRSGDGKPEDGKNKAVEAFWATWTNRCTVDGRTLRELLSLAEYLEARDGEFLARFVVGPDFVHGLALEVIDPDRLDHNYNDASKNIVMGVELDTWGRKVAYHLWVQHPSESGGRQKRERVPASEIIHTYRKSSARQTRGVPDAAPVMYPLNLLGKTIEAEVASAAHEAGRVGFLQSKLGDLAPGQDPAIPPTLIEAGPLSYIGLPAGVEPNLPDLKHPNPAMASFLTSLVRWIASGLNVSYVSLSGDGSDANYGSQRGLLTLERDQWTVRQLACIEGKCSPIFWRWWEQLVFLGLAPIKEDPKPTWEPRGWDWIDPKNDIEATALAIKEKLTTRTRELAKKGLNFREVVRESREEEAEILGGTPETAPATVPVDGQAAAVQDTALNGAQVTSLLDIINAVAEGRLPKGTAKPLILAAFPGINESQVEGMLGPIEEGKAKPAEVAKPKETPDE